MWQAQVEVWCFIWSIGGFSSKIDKELDCRWCLSEEALWNAKSALWVQKSKTSCICVCVHCKLGAKCVKDRTQTNALYGLLMRKEPMCMCEFDEPYYMYVESVIKTLKKYTLLSVFRVMESYSRLCCFAFQGVLRNGKAWVSWLQRVHFLISITMSQWFFGVRIFPRLKNVALEQCSWYLLLWKEAQVM